jgi:GxxExxY protein
VKNTKNFKPIPVETEKLSRSILDAAFQVHSVLGPGLLESVYEACLVHELSKKGIRCERQVELPVVYDGLKIEQGFRIDVLVEKQIVIELKSVDELSAIHRAQLLTYLKMSNLRLGFLLNFKVTALKQGIKKFVL